MLNEPRPMITVNPYSATVHQKPLAGSMRVRKRKKSMKARLVPGPAADMMALSRITFRWVP